MFDIGFSEILVCAGVALFVIGPERLPEAARTTGLWIGRIKRSLRDTREEIERHVGMDDVRRQLHTEEMMRTLDQLNAEVDSALYYDRKLDDRKPVIEHANDLPVIEHVSEKIELVVKDHAVIKEHIEIKDHNEVKQKVPA